jgi:hypothetical protein
LVSPVTVAVTVEDEVNAVTPDVTTLPPVSVTTTLIVVDLPALTVDAARVAVTRVIPAGVTVNCREPVTPSMLAVTVTEPGTTAVMVDWFPVTAPVRATVESLDANTGAARLRNVSPFAAKGVAVKIVV